MKIITDHKLFGITDEHYDDYYLHPETKKVIRDVGACGSISTVLHEKGYGVLISGSYDKANHYWVINHDGDIIDLAPMEVDPDPQKYKKYAVVRLSKGDTPEYVWGQDCLDHWRKVIPFYKPLSEEGLLTQTSKFLRYLSERDLSKSEALVLKQIKSFTDDLIGLMGLELAPRIELKHGGYSGTAHRKKQLIEIRYDSYLKKSLIKRYSLLVHELLHLIGLDHDNYILYSHTLDYLSYYILKQIKPSLYALEKDKKMALIEGKLSTLRASLIHDPHYVTSRYEDEIRSEFETICSDLFERLRVTPPASFPSLFIKKGGWALSFYMDDTVGIREDTWLKMTLGHKRLFIARNLPQFFPKPYSNVLASRSDFERVCLYLSLWGNDTHFAVLERILDGVIEKKLNI